MTELMKLLLIIIGILLFLLVGSVLYEQNKSVEECIKEEGYMTQCFDKQGIAWVAIYPVNYIMENITSFKQPQMCEQYEKQEWEICFTREK